MAASVSITDTDRIACGVAYQTIILGELIKYGKQIIMKRKDSSTIPNTSSRSPCSGRSPELERVSS
jgi:hypothetical protein